MNKEQIEKAFNGRWHIKVENSNLPVGYVKGVKDLCHDFFTTGILLAERSERPVVLPQEDTAITSTDFEEWWNLYQKKRGKEKCMKKWMKLSARDRQACIAATPAYVASTPDVAYRKDPYTYLNNKAWNDEIIYKHGTDNKPAYSPAEKLADILVG